MSVRKRRLSSEVVLQPLTLQQPPFHAACSGLLLTHFTLLPRTHACYNEGRCSLLSTPPTDSNSRCRFEWMNAKTALCQFSTHLRATSASYYDHLSTNGYVGLHLTRITCRSTYSACPYVAISPIETRKSRLAASSIYSSDNQGDGFKYSFPYLSRRWTSRRVFDEA